MEESLYNAKAELKRADHLINVSLKYTRTVDVIKHIIQRLLAAIDFGMETLLKKAKEQKKIGEVPTLPRLRLEQTRALYKDNEVLMQYLDLYVFLKKVDKAKFDRSQEFRRHVTMTAHLEKEVVEINIDIISDYFEKVTEFMTMVDKIAHDIPLVAPENL
jgi:hypothetical protein